ncbi:hypothetical protein E2C01_018067 [Portunus trituberculatus]|uniref:Uncharacterized protein n=1 Tax=Portunus trituberculatus TaxID=210409 RepID=A0A5B7DTJ5_PORTR|nr:hypothetical protein [Portunus trituberculatus]
MPVVMVVGGCVGNASGCDSDDNGEVKAVLVVVRMVKKVVIVVRMVKKVVIVVRMVKKVVIVLVMSVYWEC